MLTCKLHAKRSARFYRFLLRLYPSGFRARFGRELAQVFQDAYPGAGIDRHSRERLTYWIAIVEDLARSLCGEWMRAVTRRGEIGNRIPFLADILGAAFVFGGWLLVAGFLGATLIAHQFSVSGSPVVSGAPQAAKMICASAVAGIGLGISGAFGALFMALTRRAENVRITP